MALFCAGRYASTNRHYTNCRCTQRYVPNRRSIYVYQTIFQTYPAGWYFGSPDPEIVNKDFESLTDSEKKKYSVTKEILWESASCSEKELAQKEVEFIREFDSNNPAVGYNRWPKHQKNTDHG